MIGTTRSRVSFFMNKFRKLGFIEYNGKLEVHSSLLCVILYDKPEIKTRDVAMSLVKKTAGEAGDSTKPLGSPVFRMCREGRSSIVVSNPLVRPRRGSTSSGVRIGVSSSRASGGRLRISGSFRQRDQCLAKVEGQLPADLNVSCRLSLFFENSYASLNFVDGVLEHDEFEQALVCFHDECLPHGWMCRQ
jgi:hypothetical protein